MFSDSFLVQSGEASRLPVHRTREKVQVMIASDAKSVERWPCRFCGATPVLHKRKIKGTSMEAFMASCSNSRCQVYPATGWRGSESEVTTDWNRHCGDRAMHNASKRGSW